MVNTNIIWRDSIEKKKLYQLIYIFIPLPKITQTKNKNFVKKSKIPKVCGDQGKHTIIDWQIVNLPKIYDENDSSWTF